jgi:uncharacterized membrane protein
MPPDRRVCLVCSEPGSAAGELVPAELVRTNLSDLIRADYPEWGPGCSICAPDLNRYRARYVEILLAQERGGLTQLEQEVITGLREQTLVSANPADFESRLTFGQRLADRVARFGGSWGFILSFMSFLGIWIAINSIALLRRPFDPYPFILLNLILSCVAALQAPIIMMSQNRQEAKDRLRAENDYRVNLKAELEIRLMAERIDNLVQNQWQRLLEIQQIQVELIEALNRRPREPSPPSQVA